MKNTKRVNDDNFMSLVLDSVVKSDTKPLSENERLAQDAKQAEVVVKEILQLFEKHEVSPMNGYLITSALADSIYYSLMNDIKVPNVDF